MTRPRATGSSLLFAVLMLSAQGCGQNRAKDSLRLKDIQDAFVKAGFKPEGFHAIDPARFSAQKCAQGTLEGVDTLVCEFGSVEAVALGKKAGEAWIAQAATGVALDNGRTLLAVADRGRADPNGQIIHRLTQAYSHLK